MKKAIKFLLLLPLILLIQSCSQMVSAPKAPSRVDKPFDPNQRVRIAFIAPLSGNNASTGRALLHSAQLAMHDKRIADVNLIPIDSNSGTIAEKLLSENIDVVAGPLFSNNTSNVVAAASAAGIPVFSFSNDPGLRASGLYTIGITIEDQIKSVVKAAKKDGRDNFFMVTPESRYGDMVRSAVNHADVRLMKDYQYNPADRVLGFNHIVADMKPKLNEDEKYGVIFPEDGPKMLEFARALQMNFEDTDIVMLGSSKWDSPKVYGSHRDLLRDSYYPALNRARLNSYQREFTQSFGYNPPIIATLGYDVILIIEEMVSQLKARDANTLDYTIVEGQRFNNLITGPVIINADQSVSRFLNADQIR